MSYKDLLWRLARTLGEHGYKPEEVVYDDGEAIEVAGWQEAIEECLAVEMCRLHFDSGDWVMLVFDVGAPEEVVADYMDRPRFSQIIGRFTDEIAFDTRTA